MSNVYKICSWEYDIHTKVKLKAIVNIVPNGSTVAQW